ncbi:MAG: polysaccharide biosynthesis C-terminal domain-containing protein [archaeon]|nr:polysaccharide biosynthesis C-terminal domain-containing protein [archaeon]
MRQNGKELETLLGEPKKAIRSLALALSFSYLVIQLNTFFDTYWTAGLGDVPMSAVSMMSPIYWIITSSGIGLGVGAASTVAFRLGAGDRDRAGTLAANALVLGLIASVITSILVFITINPMIIMIGADEVRADSVSYVMPFILLASALILNGIISGLLRAEGAGRKSMMVLLVSALLNIVLDPILIYALDMKVAGAGWATAIGALISVVLGLYWYATDQMEVRIDLRHIRLERSAMSEVLGIAGPRTAEALVTGVTNVFQRIFLIIAGGTMAVMIYNVPFRYPTLVIVVAEAIGAAMIPVCSAALGQRDPAKMMVGLKYSAKLSFGITSVLAVVVFIFADPLMMVFTQSESMAQHHDELVWVLRMFCIFTPFDGFRKLGSCMLQVLRRSKLSTIAMLLWGLLKLTVYGLTCTISFHALIIGCVGVYIFGGCMMVGLALYFSREHVKRRPQAI